LELHKLLEVAPINSSVPFFFHWPLDEVAASPLIKCVMKLQ
jgi:hypothetical protein